MAVVPSAHQREGPFPPSTPYVGRVRELADLEASVRRSLAGHGHVVLLAGEPGIGKTRTCEEVAAVATACGARAYWGRCVEWEGAPAYWPWAQIIRNCLAATETDTPSFAGEPGAGDLARLLSDLRGQAPSEDVSAAEAAQARFRLFEGITSLLQRLARRGPLVLIIDDLHWADAPSLLLLEFLALDIGSSPILVLGTYRSGEAEGRDPLSRTLAELARSPENRRLALRPLRQEDVGRFMALTTGESPPVALLESVFRRTGGNPFFLTEVVRLLASGAEPTVSPAAVAPDAAGVPDSVRDVVGRRAGRLPAECQRLLSLASVVGLEFDLRLLGQLSGCTPHHLLDVLEQAVRAQLIHGQAVPGRFRFSHSLVWETLYLAIPWSERVRQHREVGEAIEQLHATDPAPHYAALAHHFYQAGLTDGFARAIAYARKAGEHAMGRFAWEEATGHYRRALEMSAETGHLGSEGCCELMLALGTAYLNSGDAKAALDAFTAAAHLARERGDSPRFAAAANGASQTDVAVLNSGPIRLLEEALDQLGPADSPLRVQLLIRLAESLFFDARSWARVQALAQEAVAVARRLDEPASLARALISRLRVLEGPNDPAARYPVIDEIRDLAIRTSNWHAGLEALRWRVDTSIELGDLAPFQSALGHYEEEALDRRSPDHRFLAGAYRTMLALLQGRFAEAERLAADALLIGERVLPRSARWCRVVWQATFCLERGQVADLAQQAHDLIGELPSNPLWYGWLMHVECRLGHPREAQATLDRLAAHDFTDLPRDRHWLAILGWAAEVAATLEDRERARILYDLLRPYAGRHHFIPTAPFYWGPVAHSLGGLAATLADPAAATAHFESAAAVGLRLGARPFLARTWLAHAALLQRQGRQNQEQARNLAGRAHEIAQHLGMNTLAEQARLLIDAPPAAEGAAGCLSPRELDVLRLIAAGRSNREIAEHLSLSVRTVERHTTNLYTKIGAHGRADATAYALRNRLA